jgi:hypothetical protein
MEPPVAFYLDITLPIIKKIMGRGEFLNSPEDGTW